MYRTFQLPCPLYIVNSCELFGLWGCPLHRGPVWALRQSMWCWCIDDYILIGWSSCMWGDVDQWDVWKGEMEKWLALQTFMEYSDIPSAICSNTTAKFHISLGRGKQANFCITFYVLKIILSQIDFQHFMVCHCIPWKAVDRTGDDIILNVYPWRKASL